MPSSVIETMHYDARARVLEIVFRGRHQVYLYRQVPPQEWAAFISAPSKGTYLNKVFKAKNFPFEVISPGPGRYVFPPDALRWPAPGEGREANAIT